MEPKLPMPRGPEQLPNISQSVEHTLPLPSPERMVESRPEKLVTRAEAAPIAAEQTQILPPPLPVSPQTVQPDDAVAGSSAPLVAADEDLIEKEWVDKAKDIIVRTKDDPYERERQVGLLQAEYLRKRYGKELGAS